jgi:predicted transcriptional regulator
VLPGTGVADLANTHYACSMKTLTVKVTDQIFAEISRAAEVRNVAKSEIVRERLAQGTPKAQSLWSRMADLVIDDEQVPADLSSNKNYLSGYGSNRPD